MTIRTLSLAALVCIAAGAAHAQQQYMLVPLHPQPPQQFYPQPSQPVIGQQLLQPPGPQPWNAPQPMLVYPMRPTTGGYDR